MTQETGGTKETHGKKRTYGKVDRREFIRQSVAWTAALTAGLAVKPLYGANEKGTSGRGGKKVIVIGLDGMDPRLSEQMMNAGMLPNFAMLRRTGGYRVLGTSIPPQSPVAWANFINGAGPGTHGIFDFIHRNPEKQCVPYFSIAETVSGDGYWEVGDHKLQLTFWPFGHEPPMTNLLRRGIPFWDYLDEEDIPSRFYFLPSNYPPSPSKHGHHHCLSGLGTPDMLGTYGTYQHFAEDGPVRTKDEPGGKRSMLFFENETARAKLIGPQNNFLKNPKPATIEFCVHRDKQARAAVIEIQGHKILLEERQWSRWVKLDFVLSMPSFIPDENLSGICRFYLQEVSPNFRLYISPVNTDPSDPAIKISEPPEFVSEISGDLGLFYTTGFQEDHKALSNKVFTNEEYAVQAGMVLKERLRHLKYAMEHYEEGLLFFYFSSTDLQSHMFWWDSEERHPTRSAEEARRYFNHLKGVYRRLDRVVGDILKRYGDKATVIVLSDHGFANFKRQFNLNTWLRQNGYIYPPDSTSIMRDVAWPKTRAYGLGINGLYLNLRGRERDGIVEPGRQREQLLRELVAKLEAVRDHNGHPVIRKVHRADHAYSGPVAALAPDLIIGYCRGYRASWATCLGDMTGEVLLDNDSAWSADHCADVSEVPGVIFSNKPIRASAPALVDVAPSILTEFGLKTPSSMVGRNIFVT
jgi:predicted AlkP superfamily phosphohydrolase/phosphomutase